MHTSGTSDQSEMAFKRSGIWEGYNQSKRSPYVLRLKRRTVRTYTISFSEHEICEHSNKMYLFVAIAIPLRSLIKPINACFTASERNAASEVDSKPIITCNNRNYIQVKWNIEKTKVLRINRRKHQSTMSKPSNTYLQKWLHRSLKFHWTVFHKD